MQVANLFEGDLPRSAMPVLYPLIGAMNVQSQPNRIIIFDTTLRDGEQCPGATLNVDEKLTHGNLLASAWM